MKIDFEFNEKKYLLEVKDTKDYKIEEIVFLKELGFSRNSFHIRISARRKTDNKKFGAMFEINRYQHNDKDFNLNKCINEDFEKQVEKTFGKQ